MVYLHLLASQAGCNRNALLPKPEQGQDGQAAEHAPLLLLRGTLPLSLAITVGMGDLAYITLFVEG